MAALTFELTTVPGTISASVNYFEFAGGGDYSPVINNPNPTQIHDDQPWQVRLQALSQNGAVFGAFGGNQWRFRVYFEAIDTSATAPAFQQVIFPVNTAVPFTYPDQVINIPAGYAGPGIYKLFAELVMVDSNGLTPVAGAGELTPSGAGGKILHIINA